MKLLKRKQFLNIPSTWLASQQLAQSFCVHQTELQTDEQRQIETRLRKLQSETSL